MSNKRFTPGTLIISLDFELMWGMFDKVTSANYQENLDGVATVVPALLSLFAERQIHATWAVVGMLLCKDASEWKGMVGQIALQPKYKDTTLNAYRYGAQTDLTATSRHHFAPDLVHAITDTAGQEFASHTFSHYYCQEDQHGTEEDVNARFAADTNTFGTLAHQFHCTPRSIVFPRNQCSAAALTTLAAHHYTCYRGTESHFIYRARTEKAKTNIWLRGLRFLDRYINLTGHHTYPLPQANPDLLINLPASRQLIPFSQKLALLESLRLRRIKNAMTHAAKHGEVFHLWWHPHNFGKHQAENLRLLADILDHFATLQADYQMQSCTMQEAATRAGE